MTTEVFTVCDFCGKRWRVEDLIKEDSMIEIQLDYQNLAEKVHIIADCCDIKCLAYFIAKHFSAKLSVTEG